MTATRTVLRVKGPGFAFRTLPQVLPRRSFITLPGTEATSLSESRILPYNSKAIYKLISDVDNYKEFVPYCTASKVTKWSAADSNGNKLPSEADITVGYGSLSETFTSRLFCIPDSEVEAIGGDAQTTLSRSQLKNHYASSVDVPNKPNDIFRSISTKWTIKPFMFKPPTGRPQIDSAKEPPKDQTEVLLSIDFQFSNPVYAALSKAVAPRVAGIMIEAFEERARKLLGKI